MLIDATHAEETRVVVVDGNKVDEFDFESLNKRQLAGNIYLAKVTRVEPSLQAAFIDYGGNRHGFLAFSEIHPDYYQIPVADREKLLAEEEEYAKATAAAEEARANAPKKSRNRRRKKTVAQDAASDDVISSDIVDFDESDTGLVDVPEGEKTEDAQVADDAASTPEEAPVEDETPQPDETVEETAANTPEGESDDAVEEDEIADEDISDDEVQAEVRPRKPRPRRYKIQEVVKVRQILLVQVVKEERGNKGAALTTYLSLAGRYCVLMPNTARGGGISRKITNASDRKKIKEITGNIEIPKGAGLIVRTAGAKRNKSDIERDYEYLLRQWEQIRDLTLESIAPSQIYAEGDLIKRSIRDLYNREIDEIIVDGERGYQDAVDYMTMLMPNRVSKIKRYNEAMPMFSRYQVEGYLAGMFNPTVQLKSGGYIVIDLTEALVAVDVNSGRSTKEGSIEDTALRTNLEAAEEVARQARLRDLAGLIVIDFIDMEERRNNSSVEKRLKDRLKNDRARIQVGRISSFGLLEMSRQRLRPGMLEATTAPCPHCHGTGTVRSQDSQALSIIREIEEEAVRKRNKEITIVAPVEVANYLSNQKREHIAAIEATYGISVIIQANAAMISPDYTIEKSKTATRVISQHMDDGTAISMTSTNLDDLTVQPQANAPQAPSSGDDEDQPKKKRRRRRRRGGRNKNGGGEDQTQNANANEDAPAEESKVDTVEVATEVTAVEEVKPKRTRRKKADTTSDAVAADAAPATEAEEKPKRKRASRAKAKEVQTEGTDDATPLAEEKPKPKRASRAKAKPADPVVTEEVTAEEAPKKKRAPRKKAEPKVADAASEEATPAEKPKRAPRKKATPKAAAVEATPEAAPEPVAIPEEAAAPKKKRLGWWSR